MAEPTPETQRVVKASKEFRQEDLTPDEFKKVLDDHEGTRGEVKKMTGRELEQFRANIAREEAEHQEVLNANETREKLTALQAEIDARIATSTPSVGDLEATPDPTKPKTIVDQLKSAFGGIGVGAMGVLVRGWIFLQRTLIDVGVSQGDKAKLDKIEELYGNWFGAAEMREQIAGPLKQYGIDVRKGTQDGLAYHTLNSAYAEWILKKIPEKKDAAGKVIPPTEAMINSVKQTAKSGAFLKERADEYGKKFSGKLEANTKHATTLMGIVNSESPTTLDS